MVELTLFCGVSAPGLEPCHGDSAAAAANDGESDDASLLVRVQDEDERDWTVYEREPEVDSEAQRITCAYDFHEAPAADAGGGAEAAVFTETLVHQYLLPEQLVRLVDASGLAIEEIFGGFDAEATFDPVESEHVVVVARRKAAEPEAA